MPELKHSFTAGKMNKDIDERLVANGEYIDAMNIQVRTTHGDGDGYGEAGTVQNLQGNTVVGSPIGVTPGPSSQICGSVADEKNDVAYFFVSAPTFSQAEVYDATNYTAGNSIVRWVDSIVEQHVDGTMTYVLVDNFCNAGHADDILTELGTMPNLWSDGGWSVIMVDPSVESLFRPGMMLSLISGDNQHLLQNLDGELGPIKIIDVAVTGQNGEVAIWLENVQPDMAEFPLESCELIVVEAPQGERVLNLDQDRLVTGVNVLDKFLLWTDNNDEPKKINIDRCKAGTNLPNPNSPTQTIPNDGLTHTRLWVEDPSSGDLVQIDEVEPNINTLDLLKEHVTVIRKAPVSSPIIQMRDTEREGSIYMNLGNYDFTNPTLPLSNNGDMRIIALQQLDPPIEYRVNDNLRFICLNNPEQPVVLIASVAAVDDVGSNIIIELIDVDSELNETHLNWEISLIQGKPLFELKLGRFAYRYQYDDGEYSTFSPWSRLAFLPNKFTYTPSKGYNMGMVNTIRQLTISNFIPNDSRRPSDVKTIEILYKTTDNANIYVIKTITREVDSDWELFSTEIGSNTGSVVLTSEMIHKTLPSNQLTRSWDNVPRYALSQEITGSRLLYGNYTQGYPLREDVGLLQRVRQDSVLNLMPKKSIKSSREYKFGMVFGDKYGRETPVIAKGVTSGVAGNSTTTMGDIMLSKSFCASRNWFVLQQDWPSVPPNWIEYVKYYVKETSSEYYNLVMDRWYDAEDGNIWLSFPSADRNKVDEETYLLLKNEHGNQTPVLIDARYKIIAIENEAPDYIKRHGAEFDIIRIPNNIVYGNGLAPNIENYDWEAWQTTADASGVPDGLINEKTIYISSGDFNANNLNKDYFKGEIKVRVVAYYLPGNTQISPNQSTLDEATGIYRTDWKKVSRLIDYGENRGVIMDELFGAETNAYLYFINALNISLNIASNPLNILYYLEFQDEKVENRPEFDGRFFCKVEKDGILSTRVLNEYGGDWSIQEEYAITHIAGIVVNPAENDPLDGGNEFAMTEWGDNGFTITQPTADSDDGVKSGFWSAWDSHEKKKCNIFIDGIQTDSGSGGLQEQIGYFVDQNLGDFDMGDAIITDPEEDPPIPLWDNQNLADLSFIYSLDQSEELGQIGQTYEQYINTNSGFGIANNSPNGLNEGETTDGTKGEITFSIVGTSWPGGKDGEFRSRMMTPGTYFRFKDDPNSETYVITNSSFFKFRMETNYIDGDNTSQAEMWEGNITNIPFDVGVVKNVNNPSSETDYRTTFITRFRKINKLTGQPTLTRTGIDTDIWDPRGLAYHNGVADSDDKGGEIIIQFLKYSSSDELSDAQTTIDSACWETEPKKSTDLDLYYEASSSIPVRLSNNNITSFTSPRVGSSVPALISITDENGISNPLPSNSFVNNTAGDDCVQLFEGDGVTPVLGINIGDIISFHHHDGTITKSTIKEYVNVDEFGVIIPYVVLEVGPFGASWVSDININGELLYDLNILQENYEGDLDIILIAVSDLDGDTFTQEIQPGMAITSGEFGLTSGVVVEVIAPALNNGVCVVFCTAGTFNNTNDVSPQAITFIGQGISGWYRIDSDVFNYEVELSWFNCYAFGNGVESNRIRDDFNAPQIDNGIKASTTFLNYGEEVKSSGLIYSGLYNSISSINELNQFNMGEKITKDLNPSYGSIQALKTRDTDVIVLAEDKILKVLSNKDAVFNADGNLNLTATDKVLGQTIPFVGDYGISKNPESLAWDQFRMYFTDKQRGAVLRLSRDGLTPISNVGMKSWFREHLSTAISAVGSFDIVNGEYNLCLHHDEIEITLWGLETTTLVAPNTISFNEASKGWVSFKSFIFKTGLSVGGKYLTANDNEIYEHYRGDVDRNTFGGEFTESRITMVFNDNPSSIKSFKTIGYEGSQGRVIQFDMSMFETDTGAFQIISDGEYYNLEGKEGWFIQPRSVTAWDEINETVATSWVGGITTDLDHTGLVPEFVEKEGKWFNKISGRTMDGSELNLLDPSASTVQGIGVALSAFNLSDGVIIGQEDNDMGMPSGPDDSDDDSTNDNEIIIEDDPVIDLDGEWMTFEFGSNQTNQNADSGVGIQNLNLFNNINKEAGDILRISFDLYIHEPTGTEWPEDVTSLTMKLGGIGDGVGDNAGTYLITGSSSQPTLELNQNQMWSISSSSQVTTADANYSNDIQIILATSGTQLPQAGAILMIKDIIVSVQGSDGSWKLNQDQDAANIIDENGDVGFISTIVTVLGNTTVMTNSYNSINLFDTGLGNMIGSENPNIDGWREYSASGIVTYASYDYFPY